ncbi:hypothetical protein [Bosea sp. TAF32]|uniref:hypothetical protein n=1 Tax=Bosea sp. TAF32 TaxID=3237482 RepID=UPI003F8DD6C0
MNSHNAAIPQHIITDDGPDFLTPEGKSLIVRAVMDALTRTVVSVGIRETKTISDGRPRRCRRQSAGGRQ